jgi:hypothetical protein
MKFPFKAFSFVALLSLIIGCASKSEEAATSATDENSTEAPVLKNAVCIWKEVSVRDVPEEKGKYKTTIYLGEKISYTGDTATDVTSEKKNKYVKIKLIDNTEGWVRADLVALDAVPAALKNETMIYKRPDIMTPTNKNFNQMDFVAIKSTTDGWAEVIGKRMGDTWFSTGWVKSENLTDQSVDVAFSVFYTKAMEISDETKRAEELQKLLNNKDLQSSVFYSILTPEEPVLEEETKEGETGGESESEGEGN